MSRPKRHLVLALYVFTRGVAFTLFESPLSPVDWGIRHSRGRGRSAHTFETVKRIMEHSRPDAVVIEDHSVGLSRKTRRIRRLQKLIKNHADGQGIEVHAFARRDIRACFAGVGAQTRREIAQAIASRVDAFRHRLPPPQKIWIGEPARMSLFDAASLVMTYYSRVPSNDATQQVHMAVQTDA